MRTVRVELEVEVPESATDRELEDWLRFELGATGQLDGDNPMIDHDLEAKRASVRVRSY